MNFMVKKLILAVILFSIFCCQKKIDTRVENGDSEVLRRESLYKTNNLNYYFALYLESKWNKDKNLKTKKDLEKYVLKWSVVRTISPKDSMWGSGYKLKENERMVQYLILKTEPLDVVFDDKDNIIIIYTSYE
jgi:hypothetical protein